MGHSGDVISGLRKLQWNIGWIYLRDFGRSISMVTGFIIRLMGNGPTYLGPSFWDGCLDCKYLFGR